MRAFPLLLLAVVRDVSLVVAADSQEESKAISKIELLDGKVIREDTQAERPVIGVDFRS